MKAVRTILREAGGLLRTRFRHSVHYEAKARYDLVSDVDREVEALMLARLGEIDPDAAVHSEEVGAVGRPGRSRWILDPLDGTANFIFGVPYFSISLGLEQRGRIVAGYVYSPIADELYHTSGIDGEACLNGQPIAVSKTQSLDEALVVFGFSAQMDRIQRYRDDWPDLFERCRKGLGLLAPSLNICNVARGRIDGFIDHGSSMEGHAAAALILANAGGVVRNYDRSEWDHRSQGIVAVNAALPGVAT